MALVAAIVCAQGTAPPNTVPRDTASQDTALQRTRLILKDGSFQTVLGYTVLGERVQYQSAERNGETEDIPIGMVDLPATERWQQEHGGASKQGDRAVLSPELAAEEAARRALTPEVAPNLRLPGEDSVLALDSYQGRPELLPLGQEGSDLNHETAHAVRPVELNPAASAHEIAEVHGAVSDEQLHWSTPVFYVRIGDDADMPARGAMIVDTRGGSGGGRETPSGGAAQSGYVIERMDVRSDMRVVNSFRLQELGASKAVAGREQPDVIEMQQEALPGGHWLKLMPSQPLEKGEYALVEVLSGRAVNLDVWDFGVSPGAKESYEAIRPEVRKPAGLERRPGP
jgi:hypothetical protein